MLKSEERIQMHQGMLSTLAQLATQKHSIIMRYRKNCNI